MTYPYLNYENMSWLNKYFDSTISSFNKNSNIINPILISSNYGAGEFQLCMRFAKYLLCEDSAQDSICNKCQSCVSFGSKEKIENNIDIKIITPVKNTIPIEEIRQINTFVVNSSSRNTKKIIIISNIELLTAQASNSLLKTLEEPNSECVLLLTTNKLRYILPTIKSRTIVVPITKPTGSEVKEYLDAIGANQTVNAEMLFDFYQNSPISIYESMQDNTEALILNTINTVGKMLAKKQAPIASKEIAENIKPNGEVVLNILAWMLNNLAKSIATNNTPSFMKENEILIKKWNFIIKNTSLDGCFEFERYITKVKTLLMQGFNPDLSIYINSLLYNWYLSANEKS